MRLSVLAPGRPRTTGLIVLAVATCLVMLGGDRHPALAAPGEDAQRPTATSSTMAMPVTAVAALTGPTSTTIGESVQGRAIEVGCLGSGERTVLVVGGMHTGMEAVSSELALELAERAWSGALAVPEGVRLCVLPTLNPDGLALGVHHNAHRVDLNRNWPAVDWTPVAYHPEDGTVSGGDEALSEPETRALWDHVLQTQPTVVVALHCCASLVEANGTAGAESLARAYASGAGFSYLEQWTDYPITGEFIDAMERVGVAAFDVEMVAPDDPSPGRHVAGLERVLAAVASGGATGAPVSSGGNSSGATSGNASGGGAWMTYVVQPGDTLANIAARYGVSSDAVAAANGLARPELIEVGQALRIPR
jgi:hypothetical protein